MTITEFLEARIAEDERRAGSGWSRLRETRWDTDDYGRDHLTPAAVLAECEAKRAIIAIFRDRCPEVFDGEQWVSPLHALADVYKDHPDFREEWA